MRLRAFAFSVGFWFTAASLAGAPVAADSGTERFRLENGLRVIVRPIAGARTAAVLLLYDVGGDHDPKGRSGLAHLVEHVYVTARAGATSPRSAEAFFRRYPAGCNAQTGDRYTVVATVVAGDAVERELEDAAARMGDLRVTAADLDRERPRLLGELANMFGRSPSLAVLNRARELVRPTPRGGRKGGRPDDVRAITPEEVEARWKRYYKPRNAVLVLAGDVDVAQARRVVEARFAPIEPGERPAEHEVPADPRFGAVDERAVRSSAPGGQAEVCLAYAAPEPGSRFYAPYLVLASRLFAGAATLDGAAGRFPVFAPLLDDPSVLAVSSALEPGERSPEALARLESRLAALLAPELARGESESVRQAFALLLGTGDVPDSALAANPYGAAFALGRREQLRIDPAALSRAITALDDAELRRAAAAIFAPARRAGAVVRLEP